MSAVYHFVVMIRIFNLMCHVFKSLRTGDRGQGTGDRGQGTGDRGQKSGREKGVIQQTPVRVWPKRGFVV
jgi:hypothetical protein